MDRRAATMAIPIGPQPSTRAVSPGATLDLLTACNPTAMGSVSAACLKSRPLGTGSSSGADNSIRSEYPPIVLLLYTIGSTPLADNSTGSEVTRVPGGWVSVSGPASSISALNS